MDFLIIIPAHNEEKNIFFCLKSLQRQIYKNFRVVIVNDGSTDDTARVAEDFSLKYSNFEYVNLEKSDHEPGAKVVHAFSKGLAFAGKKDWEVICKFDADIIFPPDYLLQLNKVFTKNPKAGMVSGLVKVKKSVYENILAYDFEDKKKQWIFENIASREHVRGPIKAYRRESFEDMKGLRPVLGWDNIDVMLAKMHGWEVITIKNLWVKHLRPTAHIYSKQKAEKLGEYFYNIGLSRPLAAISSAKSAWKGKSVRDFFTAMKSYSNQKGTRSLTEEEIRYIRKSRWREMVRRFNL